MKKFVIAVVLFVGLFAMQSCMTTKTQVGDYRLDSGRVITYSKVKQIWLFEGLIPLGRASVNTPSNGSFEIVEKFTFGDALISTLTVGIITTRTIKCKVKQ